MSLTKSDLQVIRGLFETQTEILKASIRDLNENLNQGQGKQNERMNRMDGRMAKMETDLSDVKVAVLELVGTDRALHSLVRELKGQNIALDERRIFSA